MKIVFYTGYHHCPWNGNTDGLGGSETAVINIAKYMVSLNHTVIVVGENIIRDTIDGVYYASTKEYKEKGNHSNQPDVLIGVNYIHFLEEIGDINAKQNIFWLHNTEHFPHHRGEVMDDNGDWVYDDPRLTAVVCVSKWQADVVSEKYPAIANKIRVIGNGINTISEYPADDIAITKNRFIYTSAADRGLDVVLDIWPTVKSKYPDAELVVCSPSYALGEYAQYIPHMERLGVTIKGSLSKKELYREMVASEFWLYPSKYDETFCITALEMLYGSCIPITTDSANLKNIILPERGFITSTNLEGEDFKQSILCNIDKAVNMPEADKFKLREANWDFAQDETWRNRTKEWVELLSPKSVKELIEHIYIIALDPLDVDKHKRWEQQLSAAGLDSIKYEVIQAIDGTTLTDDVLKNSGIELFNWKIDSKNDWWNRIMKPGERGCALSHFNVWKQIVEDGVKGALILEEDFFAIKPFTDDVAKSVPLNWDMLYLGRNPLRPDKDMVNMNIVVPDASYNLHSYALSEHGAKKLLDQNFQHMLMPVDEFIIATYTNHDREDLSYIWADSIVYAVADDVFKQDSNGKTSTTEHIHTNGRLHPELYDYYDKHEEWIKRFIAPGVVTKEWNLLCDEPIDAVFCIPFFTNEFCDMIAAEAEHLNQWTTDRHEFYPTTDILLEKIGFNDIFNDLLKTYVMPMIIDRFSLAGVGWDNMSCENFLARYMPEAQGHLSLHHDSSDISALVNLSEPGVDFTGGGTWFARQKKLYRPPKGSLSIHPGNITHFHGARPVSSGKRFIMVSFMKNPSR